jgi:hypothetical protein
MYVILFITHHRYHSLTHLKTTAKRQVIQYILPKQSHQTKSQEFPEHFHSFTDIIFQFKFRL